MLHPAAWVGVLDYPDKPGNDSERIRPASNLIKTRTTTSKEA
jgi:hypothetical protein